MLTLDSMIVFVQADLDLATQKSFDCDSRILTLKKLAAAKVSKVAKPQKKIRSQSFDKN